MNINPVSQTSGGNPAAANNGTIGLSSSQSIDTTFLNLLVTELKTQDPTSPMDPTAMVGQMVSLNQLDQLIGIRQLLTPASSSSTPAAASATGR